LYFIFFYLCTKKFINFVKRNKRSLFNTMGPHRWIQSAIMHKDALRRKAYHAGLSPYDFAQKHHHDSGRTGRQSRLALTLHNMHHHSKINGSGFTAEQLAQFLNASYMDKGQEPLSIEDYEYDPEISENYAKTYFNPLTHHVVMLHRGTDTFKDWSNNGTYATGGEKAYMDTDRFERSRRVDEAARRKYVDSQLYKDVHFSQLGHSQGAVPARILGRNDAEVITYNPAFNLSTNTPINTNFDTNEYIVSNKRDPLSHLLPDYEHKYIIDQATSRITDPLGIQAHSIERLEKAGREAGTTGRPFTRSTNKNAHLQYVGNKDIGPSSRKHQIESRYKKQKQKMAAYRKKLEEKGKL